MPVRLFPYPVLLLIVIAVVISFGTITTLWVLQPPTAEAANLSVNSTTNVIADDGFCTLREAITAANTDTTVLAA